MLPGAGWGGSCSQAPPCCLGTSLTQAADQGLFRPRWVSQHPWSFSEVWALGWTYPSRIWTLEFYSSALHVAFSKQKLLWWVVCQAQRTFVHFFGCPDSEFSSYFGGSWHFVKLQYPLSSRTLVDRACGWSLANPTLLPDAMNLKPVMVQKNLVTGYSPLCIPESLQASHRRAEETEAQRIQCLAQVTQPERWEVDPSPSHLPTWSVHTQAAHALCTMALCPVEERGLQEVLVAWWVQLPCGWMLWAGPHPGLLSGISTPSGVVVSRVQWPEFSIGNSRALNKPLTVIQASPHPQFPSVHFPSLIVWPSHSFSQLLGCFQ